MKVFFQSLKEKHKVTGLSVSVINRNQHWTHGFNWANKKKRQFMKPETAFRLGSITKLFTATMMMQLVEQKIIHLSDLVTDYLPQFSLTLDGKLQEITFYDLATHTSGLPNMMPLPHLADPISMIKDDINGVGKYPTVEELVHFEWQAEFKPKTRSEYSNMGYAILGAALASATKQTYRSWIKKNILQVLGMQNSGFVYANLSPHATGYFSQSVLDLAQEVEEVAPTPDIDAFAPAGLLAGSAQDMLPFMDAYLSGEGLISVDSISTMIKPCVLQDGAITDQAIGWQTDTIEGELAVTHTGFDYGFSSCMIIIPDRQIGVVCLCNDGMNPAIEKLTQTAVKKVLIER